MFQSTANKRIKLFQVVPKENEVLCDRCGGTGWLYRKSDGALAGCGKCSGNGVLSVCPHCGETYLFNCKSIECNRIKAEEFDKRVYEKAIKVQYKDIAKDLSKYNIDAFYLLLARRLPLQRSVAK